MFALFVVVVGQQAAAFFTNREVELFSSAQFCLAVAFLQRCALKIVTAVVYDARDKERVGQSLTHELLTL